MAQQLYELLGLQPWVHKLWIKTCDCHDITPTLTLKERTDIVIKLFSYDYVLDKLSIESYQAHKKKFGTSNKVIYNKLCVAIVHDLSNYVKLAVSDTGMSNFHIDRIKHALEQSNNKNELVNLLCLPVCHKCDIPSKLLTK